MNKIEIKEGKTFWCEGKQWRVDCFNPFNGNSGCVCLQTNAYLTFGIGEIRELIIKRKENRLRWTAIVDKKQPKGIKVFAKGDSKMYITDYQIILQYGKVHIPARLTYINGMYAPPCSNIEQDEYSVTLLHYRKI